MSKKGPVGLVSLFSCWPVIRSLYLLFCYLVYCIVNRRSLIFLLYSMFFAFAEFIRCFSTGCSFCKPLKSRKCRAGQCVLASLQLSQYFCVLRKLARWTVRVKIDFQMCLKDGEEKWRRKNLRLNTSTVVYLRTPMRFIHLLVHSSKTTNLYFEWICIFDRCFGKFTDSSLLR